MTPSLNRVFNEGEDHTVTYRLQASLLPDINLNVDPVSITIQSLELSFTYDKENDDARGCLAWVRDGKASVIESWRMTTCDFHDLTGHRSPLRRLIER